MTPYSVPRWRLALGWFCYGAAFGAAVALWMLV